MGVNKSIKLNNIIYGTNIEIELKIICKETSGRNKIVSSIV